MKGAQWFGLMVSLPLLAVGQSVDEKIRDICGTNPVISYLKEFKGTLMDEQILTRAEECAKGQAKADVYKWKLADIDIQGCLEKKYDYQKSYIESIAAQFDEARSVVEAQIEPYNTCVINVRQCGQNSCERSSSASATRDYWLAVNELQRHLESGLNEIYRAMEMMRDESMDAEALVAGFHSAGENFRIYSTEVRALPAVGVDSALLGLATERMQLSTELAAKTEHWASLWRDPELIRRLGLVEEMQAEQSNTMDRISSLANALNENADELLDLRVQLIATYNEDFPLS